MPRFEESVTIARPASEIFPWLFDADKVPRWTTALESYERIGDGPLAAGARFRQTLAISGRRITVELEITRFEPPAGAESRFSEHGFDVVTTYALREQAGETRLTQTLDAGFGSFSARLLAPIVEPYLKAKITKDLAALRAQLTS